MIKEELNKMRILAQIEILESLYDRGLKDSFQTFSTGAKLYDDVINPLINELKDKLMQDEKE